jgi:glycosidase
MFSSKSIWLTGMVASLLGFSACGPDKKTPTPPSSNTNDSIGIVKKDVIHPEWSKNATMYEVNLRQYSKEGSLKVFQGQLKRLKEMGVDIVWFMPIHPIGKEQRKGSLGSYYSVQDYKAVNPEFGTMDDFKAVVKEAHNLGMKVIIDWVANHTAHDNVWRKPHPDWFTKDSTGKFVPPVADWSDVIDLNYDNQAMRREMIESLKFWLKEADIDGFRCDVAEMVPVDFWNTVRPALDSIKPVFMLAEGERPEFHDQCFDATYTWSTFHVMNMVAGGKMTVASLDSVLHRNDSLYGPKAYRLYFTTNHDENTWNGTEYERMGPARDAFSALTFVLPGMPLIYSGQESALKKRLKFFDKDVIDWGKYPLAGFYQKLTALKSRNKALFAGGEAGYERIKAKGNESIFAFVRKNGDSQVLYVANFSKKEAEFDLGFTFEGKDVMKDSPKSIKAGEKLKLKPWEFIVLEK